MLTMQLEPLIAAAGKQMSVALVMWTVSLFADRLSTP